MKKYILLQQVISECLITFFNKLVNIRPEDSLIFNKLKNEKLLEGQTQKKECEEELIKFIDQNKLFAN